MDTALYPGPFDTLISIENLVVRLLAAAVEPALVRRIPVAEEPLWIRVIPVLNGDIVSLDTRIPTILVLLGEEDYSERRHEVRLMSMSPYPLASMGDQVYFPVGSGDFARLERETLATLPDGLSGSMELVSAMTVSVFTGGAVVDFIPQSLQMVVSFIIPQELIGREFVLLYWDEALGEWVELETTILYWDTQLEEWVREAGAYTSEGRAVAVTGRTGTYVLVEVGG